MKRLLDPLMSLFMARSQDHRKEQRARRDVGAAIKCDNTIDTPERGTSLAPTRSTSSTAKKLCVDPESIRATRVTPPITTRSRMVLGLRMPVKASNEIYGGGSGCPSIAASWSSSESTVM